MYLLSTKETAYVTARPGGIPASLKNWIHSEVAEERNKACHRRIFTAGFTSFEAPGVTFETD